MSNYIRKLVMFASFSISFNFVSCKTSPRSETKIIGGVLGSNDKSKVGDYASSVGIFFAANSKKCGAVRISESTFLTASHCIDGVPNGSSITVVSSNTVEHAKALQVHSITRFPAASGDSNISDMTSFQIKFPLKAAKDEFDRLINVAPINYGPISIGQKVSISGFGCESSFEAIVYEKCLKPGDFSRFKFAYSSISALSPLLSSDTRQFQLPGLTDVSFGYIGREIREDRY
ncbi:MAG: trypsin-like serine protease [Proteobacteria bacterium]|nr:MAG: trypsin-like serine protease [Pseudomonadota bacterium]